MFAPGFHHENEPQRLIFCCRIWVEAAALAALSSCVEVEGILGCLSLVGGSWGNLGEKKKRLEAASL